EIEVEALERAGRTGPAAQLARAGLETLARQRREVLRLLAAQRRDELLIDLFVDHEMAQPARSGDGHSRVDRPILDGPADRLAELVAASGRGLIGGVQGVQDDGHHGYGLTVHDPTEDEAVGVAEAHVVVQLARRSDVEPVVNQGVDDVLAQAAVDWNRRALR